jgi:hypothetical protein
MPERTTLKSGLAPATSRVTVNSPLGSVGFFTLPSATEPGNPQAGALTARSKPIAAWHLCGMKVRVHT